ncbi:hypothetical protein EDB84DRAFT_1433247 [Lactarius hengduanensis]|nr:hypothetical protein EDB84DRAFT_1433247 [Lactarius hengduanensis]
MSSGLNKNICRGERRPPWIWVVIWSVGGNCEKTGNCNNPIICLRENAQSPSLGLKYNEQRVENLSLRPVLEKEEDQGVVDWQWHWQATGWRPSVTPPWHHTALIPYFSPNKSRSVAAAQTRVLVNARGKIAPAHPWVDKPGKGEAPQPPLDPRQARGHSAIIGVEDDGARGLVPEHVHGSDILSENARIPTQRGKALWDRKDRKPKQDLAQTSRNYLPARRKVDVAFFPCHFLPPHDSGVGRQGKEAQELMVPVNGTRVGRGGSFLNLNATGTAVFDESAMSRPKGIERRASRTRDMALAAAIGTVTKRTTAVRTEQWMFPRNVVGIEETVFTDRVLDETSAVKGSELDCPKLSEYVKRSTPRVSDWCAVLSDGKSRGDLATWEVWLRRSGGRVSKASERLLCVVPGVTTVLAFRGELPYQCCLRLLRYRSIR